MRVPDPKVKVKSLNHVQLFETPSVACQAPLSMGFSRQEYCSGLPLPPPGDLPDPGIEPMSPAMVVDSLPVSHQGSPILNLLVIFVCIKDIKNTMVQLFSF